MKRLLVVILVSAFIMPMAVAETKKASGTVHSITPADPVKGILNTTFTIIDGTGKAIAMTADGTAQIAGGTMEAATFQEIKPGQEVNVAYNEYANGSLQAMDVTLLKGD